MRIIDGGAAPEPPLSLAEYAPTMTSPCTVCQLPETDRRQVEQCRQQDPRRFTYPVISEWLGKHRQVHISDDSLRRHFKRGHQLAGERT